MGNGKRQVFEIVVHAEKCTGCLMCQLRCSFRLTDTFNPARSAILIDRASTGLGAKISFTEECDLCTLDLVSAMRW